MKSRFANIIFLAASLTCGAVMSRAATLALPPDWRYPGGSSAAFKAEMDKTLYDGAYAPSLQLTIRPTPEGKAPDTIFQPLNTPLSKVDLAEYGSVTFKAKFKAIGNAKPLLRFVMAGGGLSIAQTFSPSDADAIPAKDGYFAFKWDYAAGIKPIGNQGNLPSSIFISYEAINTLQKGDGLDVTLIDLVFDNGGKPAKTAGSIPPAVWHNTGTPKAREIPLKGWGVDKADAAAGIKIENVTVADQGAQLPALRLTYTHSEKFSPVSLPLKFNADVENVVTFKAKVEVPAGSKQLKDVEAPQTGWDSGQFNAYFDNFGIGMRDSTGFDWTAIGVPRTHFLQHLDRTAPAPAGFKTFRWDLKNENPTGNKGFDLEDAAYVQFFYDNRKIKEGEKVVITIVQPQLVSGTEKTRPGNTQFAKFQKYIQNYKPDYTDSAGMLEAPKQGRLPAPLPLVKNGTAVSEIVGAPSVWNPDGNGVLELYRWLFRITGVNIPITAPTAADNVKIFVGLEQAKTLFPDDVAALSGSDGCAIRTRGKNVYIFGASNKGTLNGVYTFLEGNTDIIWPHPSETFGAIYTENPALAITWGDYLHRAPARNWGWMGATDGPGFDYQVRNRSNYVGLRSDVHFPYWGMYMEEGGGHNLHSFIPFSLWGTHPEYWAMRDGKREHPNGYLNQICLSNPDGQQEFLAGLVSKIERSPQARIANCYNIKIEDNWGVCECPECLKPIRLPDGTLLTHDDISFRSTQFFMFLNAIASRLHNEGYGDLQLGTYVYFYTVPVPKVPVTSALRPYFCDYVRKDHKVPLTGPINDTWWRILNEWTKVSDKVVIREYTGIYTYLRPLAEVAAYDIRSEIESGAVEFTSERLPEGSAEAPGQPNESMDVAFMEYWLINRLYWDPNADVEQLRKYFIRRTFREAAPQMEKFYGSIRELYFAEKRTTDFEENHETIKLIVRKGKDQELRSYLTQGMKDVKHPSSRKMIRLITLRYDQWVKEVKGPRNW